MKVIAQTKGRVAIAGNPGDVYLENPKVLGMNIKRGTRLILEKGKNNTKNDLLINSALSHFNLQGENINIRYNCTILKQCGLAGSASIVVACVGALNKFFGLNLSKYEIAKHALDIELETGITAGMQDRILATFGSCYMDIKNKTQKPIEEIPPLFTVYYGKNINSGQYHKKGKIKINKNFTKEMSKTAELAEQSYHALKDKDWGKLGQIMNQNYNIREKLLGISPKDKKIKKFITDNGGYCNSTGSGGAVVVYTPNKKLKGKLKGINVNILGLSPCFPLKVNTT